MGRFRPNQIIVFRSLFLIKLLTSFIGHAQDCTDAGQSVLCSENPPVTDSLSFAPFTINCFDAQLTYFFSFQTGSEPGASVEVGITPEDCDSFSGPDDISVIILELPVGGDACDPLSYTSSTACYSDSDPTTYSFNGLTPNGNFILVVGSDHDLLYGPCSFTIAVSGNAIDLTASVEPLLITLGESAEVNVSGAGTGAGYTWTPDQTLDSPTGTSTIATPDGTTTYTASSTIGACVVTDEVTVTVGPPVIIYNSFTPNSDGVNDGWTIVGIERFEDALVNVYDRWGQNVFKSLGYGSPWDGTNRGKFLPTAAYYYVIELNSLDISIPPLTGVISIVR